MNEREKLEALNKSLRDSLNNQLNDGKEQTKALLKKALVAGGAALMAYSLFKVFTADGEKEPSKKKVKRIRKSDDTESLYLVETAKKEAIAWALKMAAEQLKAFLDDVKQDEESNIS